MSSDAQPRTITGLAAARGFATGPVFIFRGDDIPVPEYRIEPTAVNEEIQRLRHAYFSTRRDLEGLIAVLRERTGRDDVRVFECHLMILEDRLLVEETERHVSHDLMNAAAAVRCTANGARAQFARMNDPYFRERVRDLDDIERRLLKGISGFGGDPHLELKSPAIVVADDLTPSETVQLPRENVLGFATNKGSATSHVALLARALGIPSVVGLGDVTSRVKAGETVLLDGTAGTVTFSPTPAEQLEFRDLIERQREISEEVSLGAPAGTLRGGGEVLLFANVHPGVELSGIRDLGARGIGLYRSEYLWLNSGREPTEEEQFAAYREAAEFVASLPGDSTVTLRMLDIGGDKTVRGITAREANPFLGNRSIRYLLSNRETFKTQLRATLRASAFGRVCIMYPMVSCVEELRAAAAVKAEVERELAAAGVAFDRKVPVGAMIEVPGAALNARAIAKYVDFFSIGTNDLVQYTMAADRGNEAVAHLYQPTHPAVLELMNRTIEAARATGVRVGVCGESASDPIIGVLWAALGAEMLSMSATYIPVMSKLFSRLSRDDLDEYAATVRALSPDLTGGEVMEACRAWMRSKIPDIDNILL